MSSDNEDKKPRIVWEGTAENDYVRVIQFKDYSGHGQGRKVSTVVEIWGKDALGDARWTRDDSKLSYAEILETIVWEWRDK